MSGPSSSSDALKSRWANAPTNILEGILQHVEIPERLTVCALVCTSWRKAAQGASSSIVLAGSLTEERLESFQQWLEKHGSSISEMKLIADEPYSADDMLELAHLPCSNLRNLELCNFGLQLAPMENDPDPGALSEATSLTCLALGTCLLYGPEEGLAKIQSLKGLRELWLCHVVSLTVDEAVSESLEADSEHADSEEAVSEEAGSEQGDAVLVVPDSSQQATSGPLTPALPDQAHPQPEDVSEGHESQEADMAAGPAADAAALPDDVVNPDDVPSEDGHPGWSSCRVDIPGEVLAALSQLTKLVLVDTAADPFNTLKHISRLTALQYLHLAELCQRVPSEALAEAAAAEAADTLAGIGQLQQLTHLVLKDVPGTFSKPDLAGHGSPQNILTALQHLQVEQVAFEPAILEGLTGLTHLRLTYVTWVVGVHDFPGQIQPPTAGRGAYKLLLVLPALQQLRQLYLDIKDWPQEADQLPAYSALTSNSNLESLELHNNIEKRMGPWVALFPAQCPLPTAAWKHVFRQGLQLPGIAGLHLGTIAEAPRTFEDRLLSCCPTVAGAPEHERSHRYQRGHLELECNDRVPPSLVPLLEVNDGDVAGVPIVLPALTTLSIGFPGTYHTFAVQSMPESLIAELQKGSSSGRRGRRTAANNCHQQ